MEVTFSKVNVDVTFSNSYDVLGGASLGGTYE
jgi:hypothetical protein